MAESLRDQLAASFDKIVPNEGADTPALDIPQVTPTVEPTPSKIAPAPAQKSAPAAPASKPVETDDGRLRDPETGKFVPKESAKPEEVKTAAKIHKAPATPAPGSPQAEAALPAVPAKPRPPRPSSWKKEYWDHWEKLDPTLAEYLNTRESQFASGVSAYKAEAEAAKPVMEAAQPFIAELQQHGIEPSRWITELGHVHRVLALGAPQQKLQTIMQVAQAYGVPLQALWDQAAQQQYFQQGQFQQPVQPLQNPQQRPLTAADADALFQQRFVEVDANRELERFAADATKHPHYDEVRNTMAQLLEANLAEDLESAYQAALRHPRHEAVWTSIQQQDHQAQEEARRAVEAQRVLKAKGKAVSPASATPSGPGTEEKPKGLRSQLDAAFDAHVGGRV